MQKKTYQGNNFVDKIAAGISVCKGVLVNDYQIKSKKTKQVNCFFLGLRGPWILGKKKRK